MLQVMTLIPCCNDTKFKVDYEVQRGMHDYLDRLVGDIYEISKIDAQIESFKSKFGFFGSSIAQHALKPKSHHNGGNHMVINIQNYEDLQLQY